MKIVFEILAHALMITGFVFTMMLLVEYINVLTHGKWQRELSESKLGQYLLGVILGAVPGCLGSFTVVSLYSHGVVSFGALVATMIATSGDEAYVMFSMFPVKAVYLTLIISAVGFIVGILTDKLYKSGNKLIAGELHGFELHEEEHCDCLPDNNIIRQLKNITFPRALLIGVLIIFLLILLTNASEHGGWDWVKVTLLISNLTALFIVTTVPDHFLEKHLWQHVLKRHLLRIFLWTFGALLILHVLESFLDLDAWIQANYITVLLLAVIIGIIPESGPHLVFVTLFANGSIPFSILLASSVVQDGHGTLPLLAVSKKSFVVLKIINVVAGLLLGFAGYFFGF